MKYFYVILPKPFFIGRAAFTAFAVHLASVAIRSDRVKWSV
jgi:hypothetical protein